MASVSPTQLAPSLSLCNIASVPYVVLFRTMSLANGSCQLAFNSPDGRTNFAVRDIIASLNFLRRVLPSFRGDISKITVAGQSSGANLIRALLATPSAASLFQSAILHSDPMVNIFMPPNYPQLSLHRTTDFYLSPCSPSFSNTLMSY